MATNPETIHTTRIRSELKSAGLSHLSILRFTSRYLPKVIHENEHIKAAIFGHHKIGEGVLDFTEGILIATDHRVIYLDHKPGFTTMDEIAYDVISGVNQTKAGLVSSVTLFTKLGNYTISFARHSSVRRFADYIETRRLDKQPSKSSHEHPPLQTHSEALEFLENHDTAVLSTVDRAGNITGAVVYYATIRGMVYIITRDNTRKARNIFANPQVALTIFDPNIPQEMQLQARVDIETDLAVKEEAFNRIVTPHTYISGNTTPPVAKIQNGAFVIFCLTPIAYSFSDYS